MPSVAFPPDASSQRTTAPRAWRAVVPAMVGLLGALALGAAGGGCFNAGSSTPADGAGLTTLSTGTTSTSSDPASPPSSAVPDEAGTPDESPVTSNPNVTSSPNSVDGTPPPQPVTTTGSARFTRVGRYALADGGNQTLFRTAGTRIGATFTGTSISAVLTDTGSDGLDVYIDGGDAQVLQLNVTSQPTSFTLASNLSAGIHTVWIVRRTEAMQSASNGDNLSCGALTLWDMTVDPNAVFMTPPLGHTRRIEAIGDSSSAGFGVETLCGDSKSNSCGLSKNHYTPRTQDVAKSIPGVVGQILNADVSNLSFSGQGVYWSYYDPGNCNTTLKSLSHCLPTLWRQAVPPNDNPAWDFSQSIDVVILSAGGDDLDANGQIPAGVDAFATTFANWVGEIRSRYPSAFIIAVLSPAASGADIDTLGGALQRGIAQAQAAQPGGKDPNMMYYNFFDGTPYKTYSDIAAPTSSLKLYYGASGHCSTAGSQWLGQRLAKVIADHMGW